MRVKRVSVKGLFGIFDHSVPLKTKERITIIHGPNGYGKTTILRLVDAALNLRLPFLTSIPFNSFEIDFEDGESLKTGWSDASFSLTFYGKGKPTSLQLQISSPEDRAKLIYLYRNWLQRGIGKTSSFQDHKAAGDLVDFWRTMYHPRNSATVFSGSDVMENIEKLDKIAEVTRQLPTRLIASDRLFIKTPLPGKERNRLVYGGRRIRSIMSMAVKAYSDELSKEIHQKLSESATLSQNLDSTFPSRLVASKFEKDYSDDEIRRNHELLREKMRKLVEVGLSEREVMVIPPDTELDRYKKGVLALYFSDWIEKLGYFDDFAERIEILMEIINGLFLHKTLSISKDKGFVLRNNGAEIPLHNLSSGEQQQLVMFYELLFKAKSHSLILIDEPELSLHVLWQEKFLENLAKIVEHAKIDVLIATHSPQIVYDREDLMVKLEGPEK